jgi:ABC-type phosphate transport system permease subunit
VTEQFGALAPVYGTLVTSAIAMLIAVPVGLLVAFFLTELCPIWLRRHEMLSADRPKADGSSGVDPNWWPNKT